MFSCEFCEIYKNTFFHRTLLVAAPYGRKNGTKINTSHRRCLVPYAVLKNNLMRNFLKRMDQFLFIEETFGHFCLFHDGGRYHIETSPSICSANQWTGFYMIMASVMKELIELYDVINNYSPKNIGNLFR